MSGFKASRPLALLLFVLANACGRHSAKTLEPAPFARDSAMTSGPYRGATPRMSCAPDLRELEVGDFVHCSLAVQLLGDRGPTTVQLASKPDLHTSTPNVLAITTDGDVIVRGAGVATLWTTAYGATVTTSGRALPRVASLQIAPFVSDTTIHVGDTLRIRAVALDDSGHEISIARELRVASTASPSVGILKRVDSSMRWMFTATAPGRLEFTVFRLRHLARLNIKVDSAPAKTVAEVPGRRDAVYTWVPGTVHRPNGLPTVGVLVTRGDQDTRLFRAGVTIDTDGSLSFTDSGGFVRFRNVEPGRRTIHVTCPVSRRVRGREILHQIVAVTPTTDTIVAMMVPKGRCVEPPEATVHGTFVGRYTAGYDAGIFRPCKPFDVSRSSAYDTRDASALVVFDHGVIEPVDTLNGLHPTFFVRWVGTLTGPGSYGQLGTATYILHVNRALEVRRSNPHDCKS